MNIARPETLPAFVSWFKSAWEKNSAHLYASSCFKRIPDLKQQTHSCARAHRQTYTHTHTNAHTRMQARTLCAHSGLSGLKIFGLESWVYPYTIACLCQKERCNNIVEPKLGQQWQTLCDLTKFIVLMHKLLYQNQTFPFSGMYLSNKG